MKTIKYISVFALVVVYSVTTSFAQFSVNKKWLKKINLNEDTVFVSLKSFSEKDIIKYKKQDVLTQIEKRVNLENTVLRQEVSREWGDKNLVFVDELEIKRRIKSNIPTVYLSADIHNDKYFDKRVGRQRRYYYFQHYDLNLNFKNRNIVSVALTNDELTQLDIHFALSIIEYCNSEKQNLPSFIKYTKNINAGSSDIKDKVLLVAGNTTSFSQQHLDAIYGYEVKILDSDEILKKIHNADENYVYLVQSLTHTMSNPMFNHFIVSTDNNKPLLLYRNSTAYYKPCNHSCFFHKKNERLDFLLDIHFKKFRKIINS